MTVMPLSGPDLAAVLERARQERADGDRGAAAHTVEAAIRSGLWTRPELWSELVSLLDPGAGYPVVRGLWLDSPGRCHGSAPILRAVAYAAARAGEHDEARALLRRAILRAGARSHRLRHRLRRLAGHGVRLPELRDLPAGVAPYFRLLDAVVSGDRTSQRRCVASLREQGEGTWLARV